MLSTLSFRVVRFDAAGTGKSIFLSFMIAPMTICLLAATTFTVLYNPRLPFYPVDALVTDPSRAFDIAFAVGVVLMPVAILLPVYFEGGLEDTPELITLCYMGILVGLLFLMFAVSLCLGAVPDVKEDTAVRNLPYAARSLRDSTDHTEIKTTSPSKTSGIAQSPSSQRTALSLQSLPQAPKDIHHDDDVESYRDRTDTGMTAVSGMLGFGEPLNGDDGHAGSVPTSNSNDVRTMPDNSEHRGHAPSSVGSTDLFRRASTKSAMWAGWEVGMACMAEFPPDGTVHSAHIVSLDWDHGKAVVSYDGYDGDHGHVPISRLYGTTS